MLWFINNLGNGNVRLQNETGFLLCVLPDGSTILKDADSINDFPSETLVSTFNITELPNADPHSQYSEFAGTYISTNVDIMMYVHRGKFLLLFFKGWVFPPINATNWQLLEIAVFTRFYNKSYWSNEKKFSRTKKFQNYPKNLFFELRSCC